MPRSVFLDELPWTEVDRRLRAGRDRLVVLLGSTENHGPHAPLGTDTIIARGVGRRLAERIDALATPPLPFGYAAHHLSFPGSVSLTNRTLATVLVELVTTQARHGFRTFVFLSGHGGNRIAIELARTELADAVPADATLVHAHMLAVQTAPAFTSAVQDRWPAPFSEPWGAHGGEQETAAVLAERPDLVDLDLAPPVVDMSDYLRATRDPAVTSVARDLRDHVPHGTWGDPRGATAEQGDVFLNAVAEELAGRVRPLLPPPRRGSES